MHNLIAYLKLSERYQNVQDKIGSAGLLSSDKRKLAVVGENNREYRGSNGREATILIYRVDGGLIQQGQRCDYAIGVSDNDSVYLIELKGSDLKHAASQISATLDTIGDRISECTVHGRVILSRVSRPDLRASGVIALERRLAQHRGSLIKACSILEENI